MFSKCSVLAQFVVVVLGLFMLTQVAGSESAGTVDVCSLPAEAGRCRAFIPMFHFNASTGRCERFVYGGCGGNGNRFIARQKCVDKCGTNNENRAINPTDETSPDFDQIATDEDYKDAVVDDLKFEPSPERPGVNANNMNGCAMDRWTWMNFIFAMLTSFAIKQLFQ